MGITKAFTIYAVDMDGSLIDQVQNLGVTAGMDEILAGGDGSVFNKYIAAGTLRHGLTFDTTAIKTALDACDLDGTIITSGALFTAYFQKLLQGGTRAGATSHLKMVINEGILAPRNINVEHGQAAIASYEAMTTYDGSNVPIVMTASQSLTGTPNVDEIFTVGPVKINGTLVEGIQGISIELGLDIRSLAGDGEVYPTYAYIAVIQPIIRFRTLDIEQLVAATMGLGGVKRASDTVVYLRKVDEGGTRVADGTSEHISFTINEARIHVDEAAGGHGEEAIAECILTPPTDNTNDPIVIDTTAAIV